MNRTKKQDVDQLLVILNGLLASAKSTARVKREGRYGYQALDHYDLRDRCRGTIKTGLSTGQALYYVEAMIEGIELYTRKAK